MTDVIQSSMFPEIRPEATPTRDPREVEAELNKFRHETGDKVKAGIEATGKTVNPNGAPSEAAIDQGHGAQPGDEIVVDVPVQKLVGPAAARAALRGEFQPKTS